MSVYLYVEGGGDSSEERSRCREGFRKLLERAGFRERMPRIVACGSRNAAFDSFKTALRDNGKTAILLVDSEDTVRQTPWTHLQARDGWMRPPAVVDDQVQLMVTCMETWIISDRPALKEFYGAKLNENALVPLTELENRSRDQIQNALVQATRACGRRKEYKKGNRSFQVLATLNPGTLREHLPHFRRLVSALNGFLG